MFIVHYIHFKLRNFLGNLVEILSERSPSPKYFIFFLLLKIADYYE